MLEKIYIKNYILIKELTLPFQPNFNVMTGETGAGKSIILGALSLILGDRADTNTLLQTDEKCIIEGHFDISELANCKLFLEENDLDYEPHTIIRREISPQGKSRAFINDSPVTLQLLNQFTSQLVDLHRQFDNLAARDHEFTYQIVDALAEHKAELQAYETLFKEYNKQQHLLKNLIDNKHAAQQELDYKLFLLEELTQFQAKEDEIETLEASAKLLEHADEIRQNLQSVSYGLSEDEYAVTHQLKKMLQSLQQTQKLDEGLQTIIDRVNSVYVELKDIAEEIDTHISKIEVHPEQLSQAQERLDMGFKLLKKHQVNTTNELIAIQQNLEEAVGSVANIDEEIEQLTHIVEQTKTSLTHIAQQLHEQRTIAAVPFAEKVTTYIRLMGMKNAHFKVDIQTLPNLGAKGLDALAFLIDSNNSGKFAPIQKSASGGELSRLMLAIKTITAQKIALPTLIFDEVDTGISGESAKQVGELMKELGSYHQIICITHQPQVAAKAHHHYFVYKKENEQQQIETAIKALNESQRVQAIARMIGGDNVSEAAMNNAKELMS